MDHDGKNLDDPPELVEETEDMSEGRRQFDTNIDLGTSSSPQYWASFINETDLESLKSQAYVNTDGLAIRTNPQTGYKELFIAGSRTHRDWTQNALEAGGKMLSDVDLLLKVKGGYDKAKIVYAAEGLSKLEALDPTGTVVLHGTHNVLDSSTVARDEYAAYIDRVIEANDIDIVYGHSRGAATASGLKSDVKIIGLDGAMYIAHPSANFLNLTQTESEGFAVDTVLQAGYKHSLSLEHRAFHDVTRASGQKKRRKPGESAESKARAKAFKKFKKVHRPRRNVKILDKLLGRKTKSEKEDILKQRIKANASRRHKIEKRRKDKQLKKRRSKNT